jgi:hypothetical protein
MLVTRDAETAAKQAFHSFEISGRNFLSARPGRLDALVHSGELRQEEQTRPARVLAA